MEPGIGNTLLRMGVLGVGCLATGTAYTLDAFTVYSEDFRIVFGAKQSQVETVISAGYIGLLSSLPAGLLQNRVGPRWMSFISLVFSVLGSGLCWLALQNKAFHTENFTIFAFYYFLMGFGGGIMYVTASSVSIANFGQDSLGLVSGMVHAFRSGIPGLFMVLYMYVFSSSYYSEDERDQRLFIFYTSITVCYMLSNGLAICIYGNYRAKGPGGGQTLEHTSIGHLSESFHMSKGRRPSRASSMYGAPRQSAPKMYTYRPEQQQGKEEEDVHPGIKKYSRVSIMDDRPEKADSEKTPLLSNRAKQEMMKTHLNRRRSAIFRQRTMFDNVKTPEFHLIFWPSAVILGFRSSFGANIRLFADSFGLQTYAQIILTILPLISTLSKPPIGLCSDALLKYIPRSSLLIVWAFAVVVVDVLCIFLMNEVAMQATAVVTVILCSSFIQTLTPPLMVTALGRKFFPIGWACVVVGWSGCTSIFNVMIGNFYDANIGDDMVCMGLQCYRYSFTIASVLCAISAVLYCFLLKRELQIRRTME